MNELQRDQLETALLEPGDDFTDEATMNAVRLWSVVFSNLMDFKYFELP